MTRLALAALLAAAVPALAQEPLPPPPPPPEVPLPPPPAGTRPVLREEALPPTAPYRAAPAPASAPAPATAAAHSDPTRIGEGPIAPAGAQAAPLHPDERVSHWRSALATGVAGRFGGLQLHSDRENPGVLLYFGAQADGLWTEGIGRAARLRLRLFTGGETEVYVPSDGEVEAAFMIGRREFRFVLGRAEVGRYPALGIQTIAQLATLPCFEGSLPLAGDTMRVYYYVSPVEASWVRYIGKAHVASQPGWASESKVPVAATSARLRWTTLLPPAVLLSVQGDLVKMWSKDDLLLSAEGSLGYQVLEKTVVFNAAVRWDSYVRRGQAPDTSETDSQMMLLGIATLVF
jgi:hypothetical protein